MAIDGLKEVQESAMRITTGLSTYQNELALQGQDYEEVMEQQEYEIQRRREMGLSEPSGLSLILQIPTITAGEVTDAVE